MIKKQDCTNLILTKKDEKELSFQEIADKVGKDIVWVTSALLGQNSMTKEEAQAVANLLELNLEAVKSLQQFPMKGCLAEIPPTDPLIYRLYEIILVYGTTLKAVIHEKMGDGIMSAIDFSMNVEKVEDPLGDRVKITMNGKFLPYKRW